MRRAYGNWKSAQLKPWEDCLHEYAIRPVQQFDYTKGKNATDVALIIDAMDLLYTQKLDAFAIISSDCDFTPLVMRLLTNGLTVYGFGEKKTPSPFIQACSTFLYLEELGEKTAAKSTQKTDKKTSQKKEKASSQNASAQAAKKSTGSSAASSSSTGPRQPGKTLKQDTKLINLLRSAVTSIKEDDGWARLSKVGAHISSQVSFDPRHYGYAKLSALFEAIDLFEIRRQDKMIYVRSK